MCDVDIAVAGWRVPMGRRAMGAYAVSTPGSTPVLGSSEAGAAAGVPVSGAGVTVLCPEVIN